MPRYLIGRASELPPGTRRLVHVGGKAIVIFNIKGELFALSDKCPHRGASLSNGVLTGLVTSSGPGDYSYSKAGEIIRCPWHQWEFDVRTGRSHCDPKRMRLMQFSACVAAGADLVGDAAYQG
jgi:nitrite reductase/ring-hydroxylating ferredoxin subunit